MKVFSISHWGLYALTGAFMGILIKADPLVIGSPEGDMGVDALQRRGIAFNPYDRIGNALGFYKSTTRLQMGAHYNSTGYLQYVSFEFFEKAVDYVLAINEVRVLLMPFLFAGHLFGTFLTCFYFKFAKFKKKKIDAIDLAVGKGIYSEYDHDPKEGPDTVDLGGGIFNLFGGYFVFDFVATWHSSLDAEFQSLNTSLQFALERHSSEGDIAFCYAQHYLNIIGVYSNSIQFTLSTDYKNGMEQAHYTVTVVDQIMYLLTYAPSKYVDFTLQKFDSDSPCFFGLITSKFHKKILFYLNVSFMGFGLALRIYRLFLTLYYLSKFLRDFFKFNPSNVYMVIAKRNEIINSADENLEFKENMYEIKINEINNSIAISLNDRSGSILIKVKGKDGREIDPDMRAAMASRRNPKNGPENGDGSEPDLFIIIKS